MWDGECGTGESGSGEVRDSRTKPCRHSPLPHKVSHHSCISCKVSPPLSSQEALMGNHHAKYLLHLLLLGHVKIVIVYFESMLSFVAKQGLVCCPFLK